MTRLDIISWVQVGFFAFAGATILGGVERADAGSVVLGVLLLVSSLLSLAVIVAAETALTPLRITHERRRRTAGLHESTGEPRHE